MTEAVLPKTGPATTACAGCGAKVTLLLGDLDPAEWQSE